jgi:hypothetical protein
MKKLTKKQIRTTVKELRENLENLFSIGFYSDEEYKINLDEIDNLDLYLTFSKN